MTAKILSFTVAKVTKLDPKYTKLLLIYIVFKLLLPSKDFGVKIVSLFAYPTWYIRPHLLSVRAGMVSLAPKSIYFVMF